MIAPTLPKGLEIRFEGELVSRPYVEMTLNIMKEFGVSNTWVDRTIKISNQKYVPTTYRVEADWSSASYWYTMASLDPSSSIKLPGLRKQSYQGDRQICQIMEKLGVLSIFDDTGVQLIRTEPEAAGLLFDFRSCPDLAQTVIVACAASNRACEITGIENLAIKETDRIQALEVELAKVGLKFQNKDDGKWKLVPDPGFHNPANLEISTYEDHRMAMAFAPLVVTGDLLVQDPKVVRKSYPRFWKHLALAGVKMETVISG